MSKSVNKLRPLGDVLLDLEPLLYELTSDHELQRGEVLALMKAWCDIHMSECIEQYQDDTEPVYYYGHKNNLLEFAKKHS